MRLEQSIRLRQQQTLTMTPQLQQAIKMLQMTATELGEYIDAQVLENPFLQKKDDDYPSFYHKNTPTSTDTKNWIESTVAVEHTLKDHLRQQLGVMVCEKIDLFVGEHLIDLVNDAGYIEADLYALSQEINVPFHRVMHVLSIIQTFDPVGVGARTLMECLSLQLKEKELLTDEMSAVVENLALLTTHPIDKIAKISQITKDRFKELLTIIRTLNPKPGACFVHDAPEIRVPDIMVHRAENGRWVGQLNEESLPKVLLDSAYCDELLQKTIAAEDRQYLRIQRMQGTWLIRCLAQRAETILRVAQEIIRHQQDFFNAGPTHILPLNLREIATAIGLHESTVSRATMGKFIATPRGVFEFRYFLATGVSKTSLSDVSSVRVQEKIKLLIQKEKINEELSDDQLVGLLRQEGIVIARRTVTKYRECLGIPSTYERRRQKKLTTF